MIKKPAFRYYCEFCGKSGGSASHMSRHEKYCTANPNRRCGMCDRAGQNPPHVADMVAALGDGDEAGLTRVQEMCMKKAWDSASNSTLRRQRGTFGKQSMTAHTIAGIGIEARRDPETAGRGSITQGPGAPFPGAA
jgi:hypothetical protein